MGNSCAVTEVSKKFGPIQGSGMHPILSSLGICGALGTKSYTNRGLVPCGTHVQPLSGNLSYINSQALPT